MLVRTKSILLVLAIAFFSCTEEVPQEESQSKKHLEDIVSVEVVEEVTKAAEEDLFSTNDSVTVDEVINPGEISEVVTEKESLDNVIEDDKVEVVEESIQPVEEPIVEVIEEPVVEVTEDPLPEKEVNFDIDHRIWNDLLKTHVSAMGIVNYKGFKKDINKLDEYLALLSSSKPNSKWHRNPTMAYWINAYNAYTIKLIVDDYPLKSITELSKPWDKKFIEIQGEKFSLGDIENKILRKMNEPRIHFVINCASKSCPKLLNKAYTTANLSSELKKATNGFLVDKGKNVFNGKNVQLSKVFEWYKDDFNNGNIIEYLNENSNLEIPSNASISYLEYDWSLNE